MLILNHTHGPNGKQKTSGWIIENQTRNRFVLRDDRSLGSACLYEEGCCLQKPRNTLTLEQTSRVTSESYSVLGSVNTPLGESI